MRGQRSGKAVAETVVVVVAVGGVASERATESRYMQLLSPLAGYCERKNSQKTAGLTIVCRSSASGVT